MSAAAVSGWLVAGLLAAVALGLGRRLSLLADAEHELRGPVAALAMLGEALARGPETAGHAAGLLAHVDRLRLALDDLHAARWGRRGSVTATSVPLAELLEGLGAGWRPAARRAGGDLRTEAPTGLCVRTDGARLGQAMANAVANAVEHGGADVDLRARALPGGVRVEIRDGGRSGAAPARPRSGPASAIGWRDAWRQLGVPGAAARRSAGLRRGRGLRIARRAARRAGGRFVLDRGPQGTVAVIELPAEHP